MGLFSKLFKKAEAKPTIAKKGDADSETDLKNQEFMIKYEQVKNLFAHILSIYNSEYCQCAFPRFQQIVGIDCSDTGNTFKCYDTDLLISMSKSYFEITNSDRTDEVTNEKWTCKKCGSTYEFGWSDFSIYIERQKLELTNLKTPLVGKTAHKPVPLYLGLIGYSYPPKTEIARVDFLEFEKYMNEQED